MSESGKKKLNPLLLDILVCPVTKTELIYDAARQELLSAKAGLAYPVRDGMPVMLAEEARALTAEEIRALEIKKAVKEKRSSS